MDRRQRVQVSTDPDARLYVYTPEDILLQKLAWYRMGIILVQEDRLDRAYLEEGAKARGVSDLLQRALRQARGE